MAIFKSSNASPNLSEIDATVENTFEAQVNTSGEPAKAYKFTVMSEDASETVHEGTIHDLTTPVKNKNLLKITSTSETGLSLTNGKDYQWGVRMYNTTANSTAQPNTLVCSGYTVGSTKYVTWLSIPNHNDEFKGYGTSGTTYYSDSACTTSAGTLSEKTEVTLNGTKSFASFESSGTTYYLKPTSVITYKSIADNIVYDRYIEYSVDSADTLLIGGHEPDTVEKPTDVSATNPYIQRKKIDWVDKGLGTDEDFLKIETDEAFDYDYADGTSFSIYKCSSEHTVTSAFADPNSNINISDFIMIYETPAKALAAFTAGELPGGDISTAIYGGVKKITGYSSDTGEIRVHDAWPSAPVNGNAYRIFEQDVTTKTYSELFSSSVTFTAPAGTQYYGTIIYATSDVPVNYYSDPANVGTSTGVVGQLITGTSCTFVKPEYSTITKGSVTYYVATPNNSTLWKLTKQYDVSDVNGVFGKVVIDSVTYAIPYSSLTPLIDGEPITGNNPYLAQVIGGRPITDTTYFKNISNHWGSTAADKRLFIQPNINIKTDPTNPNEIVFDSNGARVDIIKQTKINSTTGKTIDITFNKLDNSQWLLTGDALSLATSTPIPTDSNGHIVPQTDYKVYTDFMDSAPLNLFYARKEPTLTIQCRNYYQTLRAKQGQTFGISDNYYVTEGTQYYQDSTCTDLAEGSYVYLPVGEAYYTNYTAGAGFSGDVAYLTEAITEDSHNAVYQTNICTNVTLNGTTYYAHSPSYKTKSDTKCTWTSPATTGTITDSYNHTRYVKVASIRENPSIYMDMPSVLYQQIYSMTTPEYEYRDFEFYTKVEFTNNQQVKYYNYVLSVKTTTGGYEVISTSEDIYSTDVEWHFRGFERGESRTAPKYYRITVNIVDNYDKSFSKYQDFSIYYPVEEAVTPLELTYDCHEKGITVNVRDPLYVATTDLAVGGMSTVTSDNLYEVGGEIAYLYIPENKVLNYTNVDNDEFSPIYIPAKSEILTQFQLRGEFIEAIPNGGESVVLQIANEYTETEYQAGLQSGVNQFNNAYNNNVKYTEIAQQPVYTPTTPSAAEPTDMVMYPNYYQCVIGETGTSIFVKGTEGVKYYSDTACTTEAGTIETDIYAVYTDATYSTITIGEDNFYVKNNRAYTDGTTTTVITDGIANAIIRYNRIYKSGDNVLLYDDNAAKVYLQGLIEGITPAVGDNLLQLVKNADYAGNKIIYAINSLSESIRYSETTETTNMTKIKKFLNNIYYITQQNIDHKTDDDTAYLETYTLTFSDVNSYYFDEDTKKYVQNPNVIASLKMYKNGDMFNPLTCFNVNGTLMDHYSISDNIEGIVSPKNLRYALQLADDFVFCTEESSYLGKLPITGVAGKFYVIYNEYVRGGVTYKAGIYTYNTTNSSWTLDTSNDYLLVEKKADLPTTITDPSTISDAVGVYVVATEKFIWLDTDENGKATAWIENTNANLEGTKEGFNNLWLTLFGVCNYAAAEGQELICDIKYSKGEKL